MPTGNTVKRLNSGATSSQPEAQPERQDNSPQTGLKESNPGVTATYKPEQNKLPGTDNHPPNTGPVEK